MTTKSILPTLLILFLALSGMAQSHDHHDHEGEEHSHRTCGTVDYMHKLKASDANVRYDIEKAESEIQKWVKENPNVQNQKQIVTIPVVVHVLYRHPVHNISDAQINSQITILNQDYRRTNADASNTPSIFQSVAADCEIEFCLAQQDPDGNFTTGITRTQVNKSSFDINNNEAKFTSMGGKDAWDRNKYLNIWIVPAISDNGQSGILGYAQMPGGPSSTDGVVIQHKNFGNTGSADYPFDKGRTATHEVGHWLSLYHIWGDDGNSCFGSDQVDDTPNQADENYGCPSFPESSCNNTSDMYMNFMDYTDDACMNIFTKKQKARMWAVLNSSRLSLQSSIGCNPVGIDLAKAQELKVNVYPNPNTGSFKIEFTQATDNENIQIRAYNSLGKEVFIQNTRLSQNEAIEMNLGHLPHGLYQMVLSTRKGTVCKKIMIQ